MTSSLLFTPFSFSNLRLRNKVVMPPMATAFAAPGGSPQDDGLPGELIIEHYRERAANQVGMIIVEHTYVEPTGKAHKGQLGLASDGAIPYFEQLSRAIESNGAVPALQINHVGAAATPEVTGSHPIGPSDVPTPKFVAMPKGLAKDQIRSVQRSFAASAERAQKAGFRAVEIHCAHGYLGYQFLSPVTNVRDDEYGGSIRNRARFILETVLLVRERLGDATPVFVRLGTTDGDLPSGFGSQDAVEVARMLEDSGVSLIDVSGGFSGSRPPEAEPGYFVDNASLIKKRVGIPVMVTGGITKADFAESILAQGKADLIGIGRALLQDPAWVLTSRRD